MIAVFVLAPTAAQIVADVQAHYAKQTQLTATFTQVATDATFGSSTPSEGTVYLARPGKMDWDYFPHTRGKAHKEFIFDGETLWAIDHANKSVQKIAAAANAQLPAAMAFLSGQLANDFALALVDATTVELTPKQPMAGVKSLRLHVDPGDGHVITSSVIDTHGNTNAFTFGPQSAAKIPAAQFVFDPKQHPTYRVQ